MNLFRTSQTRLIDTVLSVFIFVLLVDPADNLIGLKMPLFALFTLFCILTYHKANIVEIRPLSVFIGICIITSLIGFFRGINIDQSFALSIYKSLIMAILLLWSSRLMVLEKLTIPTLFVGILVVFIYICSFLYPDIIAIIYPMTRDPESPWPIMMSKRTFIGIDVISVFYKTSPLFLLVAAVYLHRLLNHIGDNKWNLLVSAVSLSTLFMSGTRMNVLSCFAMLGAAVILRLRKSKAGRLFAVILSISCLLIGVIIVSKLINDTGEHSLDVKTTLAEAFYNEVDKDPLMLILGQGAGATFDSLGVRGKFAVQSELTYFDVIRWFGIPGLFLIMSMYCYPLILIYRKRKLLCYWAEIMSAYILYLFIAATNPLLISSTGILALFTMYSYALNPHYEYLIEKKNNESSNLISNV